ncbi:MAG TPA: isoprenylcysteine carboxylmethyltransferase family protein [Dehalococcoidia bacterium]|nr:isoprenylcysteine carboxylmethyltransferase family protein [Dehalococcoidia bacterium]
MNESTEREPWKPTWKDIALFTFLGILFVGQVVYCFISYNGAGWDVVLYIGWAVFAFSMILGWLSRIAFEAKGKAPEGESFIHTAVVVESGIYTIVRHPMYLSGILIFASLVLISQHWLSLIFSIPIIVYFYISTWSEERSSIERFGDDYRKYMQRVPRMNLIWGIIKLWRRQKYK